MKCPHCGHDIDPPRTRAQQGRLHAMLTEWARWDGVSLEQKKMEAKVAFGMFVAFSDIEEGAPLPEWRGRWVDLSHYWPSESPGTYALVKSEADYTKAEEAEFMAWIENRMMDAHVPMESRYGG